MIRSILLGLTAALTLAISSSAQTVMPFPQVNSGCASPQTISGTGLWGGGTTVKIGTTVTFTATWPNLVGVHATVLVFGFPTGNLQDWSAIFPFCTPGPCKWYLAPYDGANYNLVAVPGNTASATIVVPNLVSLVQNGVNIGVQAMHADLTNSCWDMSYAYNRPIVIN